MDNTAWVYVEHNRYIAAHTIVDCRIETINFKELPTPARRVLTHKVTVTVERAGQLETFTRSHHKTYEDARKGLMQLVEFLGTCNSKTIEQKKGVHSNMTEHIDHNKAAKDALEIARIVLDSEPLPHNEAATLYLAETQAHATLALVEQQRIANLIALTLGTNEHASVSNQMMDDAYHALADSNDELHPHIKTMMGIQQ